MRGGKGLNTWFERMLRFERNTLELGDAPPESLSAEVTARAAFFERYLLKGETPAAFARTDAELGKVWSRLVGTSDETHYGRPFTFHQQAQRQNWPGAWARVRAPVLVMHGEYDWFESRTAAELIANIVKRRPEGKAWFRELPKLDHHFTRFETARDARRDQGGQPDASQAVATMLSWLSEIGVRDRT